MAARPIGITVTLRGGLFSKNIPRVVEQQIVAEIITKVEERTARGGRGLGAKRNIIGQERAQPLSLAVSSTLNWPRTRGTAWQRKNIAIVKAMAPRVGRKAAERIAEELGGA